MENEKEMREAVESASFQMWQAYCNKKMECEDLQEQVETQAARIAELEAQVKQLQRVPLSDEQFSEVLHSIPDDDDADSEWMLTDYQLQLIKDGIEAAHNIK
jgi:DNA repair ATPase RecN